MKYLKKVSASQLISNEGTIIDSMMSGDDQHINAPSIDAVKNYVSGIVESGSNENGAYVKYADGTMICYGIINIAAGSTYTDITFPQSFTGNPIITITNVYLNRDDIIWSVAGTRAYVKMGNGSTVSVATRGYYTAIGRWKAYVPYNNYSIRNAMDYTENETVIGTWFGKPLYRRVVSITLPNSNDYTYGTKVADNIDYATVEEVFTNENITRTTNGFSSRGGNVQTLFWIEAPTSGTPNQIAGYSDRTDCQGKTFYCVCKYTKTSD